MVDHLGNELPEQDSELLRLTMAQFTKDRDDTARAQIDYVQWAALFGSSATRKGLGSRIREHLVTHEPALIEEFDDLQIQGALDENDYEAATSLLDVEVNGESLVDILPTALRKRVEKVAVPPAAVEDNPLRALLRFIVGADDLAEDAVLSLELDPAQGRTGNASLAVFTLLYGRTLAELMQTSELGNGRSLKISQSLTKPAWPTPRKVSEDEIDEETEDPWAPVHLALTINGETAPQYRFRWSPDEREGYGAFAALVRGIPVANDGRASDLEGWCAEQARGLVEEVQRDALPKRPSGLTADWQAKQAEHFAVWADTGLSVDLIQAYVDDWSSLVQAARDSVIPMNSPVPELDRFLDADTVHFKSGHAMLATHPLRLRWFGAYLKRLRDDLQAALDCDFRLNPENDALYFNWLSKLSPHRQPPILVAGADQVCAPAREFALHEEYDSVRIGGGTEKWVGAIDEGAIDALAQSLTTYVDAFPHKIDGLTLLILTQEGDARVPDRLVKQLLRDRPDVAVELHVVAPRPSHRAIAAHFSDVSDERDRDVRLLPQIRLVLHDWPADGFDRLLSTLSASVDVAFVPNLFGAHTQLQVKTREREGRTPGRFDPLLDAASHTPAVSGASGENVSRTLLPSAPDPLLEAWSTLGVRRFQQSAVAPESPENTDYFTLQVTFDRSRALFDDLHDVAHWVVTLDPFVGRDQIDALEDPPEVILVRSGLGKNKTHTLVVSSRAGRRFVVRGLERRLHHNLKLVSTADAQQMANRLYDIARGTLPGVLLRALGLGRTLEEIIGLVITRYAVEEAQPRKTVEEGIDWWVSLDDHTAWFGGSHQTRADLLRVTMWVEGDDTRLNVQVVESKFRTHEDLGAADRQLARSCALFREALAPGDEDTSSPARDTIFWRRELVTALDETSRRTVEARDLPPLVVTGDGEATVARLRSKLLEGAYSLEVSGLACALATADETAAPLHSVTDASFALIRLHRPEIAETLNRIHDGLAPAADDRRRTASAAVAPGEEEVLQPSATETAPAPTSSETREPELAPEAAESRLKGLSQSDLEGRYQKVLDAFHEFKVDVSPPDGARYEQGPSFYLVRIVPGAGVAADKVMSRTTDLKLRLQLPAELEIRTYTDRGAVVFEVPKQAGERYPVEAEQLWSSRSPAPDRLEVAIGENIAGEPVAIDFSSSDSPHLLIAGTTGSGKSVALETIITGLCRQKQAAELKLFLVDPKGTELVDFEGDPHLVGDIGMDGADAIQILESAVTEMQRRYGLFKPLRVRDLFSYNAAVDDAERLPWNLIVLDEYADLMADPDDKRQIEALLKRVAQKARAAGIHLIIATQRPSVDVISPIVRSNLPAQLALRVRNATDSRVILDESGAEALAGYGDALLRTARGLTRIQCGMV